MPLYNIMSGGEPGKGEPGKGEPVKPYSGGKTATPTGKSNAFVYKGKSGEEGYTLFKKEASDLGFDINDEQGVKNLQEDIYDNLMSTSQGRSKLKEMWKSFGDTAAGSSQKLNPSDQDLESLKESFVDGKLGARTMQFIGDGIPPRKPVGKEVTPPESGTPPEPAKEEPGIDNPSWVINVRGDEAGDKGAYYFPKNKEDMDKIYQMIKGTDAERGVGYMKSDGYSQMTVDMNDNVWRENIKDPKIMELLGQPYKRSPKVASKFVPK